MIEEQRYSNERQYMPVESQLSDFPDRYESFASVRREL